MEQNAEKCPKETFTDFPVFSTAASEEHCEYSGHANFQTKTSIKQQDLATLRHFLRKYNGDGLVVYYVD